jgi:hypothetical protein
MLLHQTALLAAGSKDTNLPPDNKMSDIFNLRIVEDQDYRLDMVANMKKFGGSFVQALAECFVRADGQNLVKLTRTFSKYVDEYLPEKWEKK